jgi:hypothetical protein
MTLDSHTSRVRFAGELPTDWHQVADDGADLRLQGPTGAEGVRGTLAVRVDGGVDAGIEEASMQTARPEAILANCELWPHPVWGDGRYIQSAYIDGRTTMAHDTYLFVDHGRRVRVEVDCALADLLGLEETIAALVARLSDATPVMS